MKARKRKLWGDMYAVYYMDRLIYRRDVYFADGTLESLWQRYSPSEPWRLIQ